MIKHKCELCGKEKDYRYKSLVKRFCSHKCANEASWQTREKGEAENITCKVCGEEFSVLLSAKRARERDGGKIQFCSKKCMGIGARTRMAVSCKNCGNEFETNRLKGINKRVFCGFKCAMEHRKKTGSSKKSGCWLENGYRVLYLDGDKSIKEHKKVMQDYLGRELAADECVHHINGDKLDNRIENLQLMKKSEHSSLHRMEEKAKGNHLFGGYNNN